eukprot:1446368-Pleurochrysis_carterae.AAC.1
MRAARCLLRRLSSASRRATTCPSSSSLNSRSSPRCAPAGGCRACMRACVQRMGTCARVPVPMRMRERVSMHTCADAHNGMCA